MCGFVGMFDPNGGREIDRALLSRMNETLVHRGPDDSGLHFAPGLGFGHRRLAIIDLAGGIQPMFNEDRSVVVVYNGEIYNFRELSRELRAAGHSFRTESDTEVIVHAWEEWGEACVQRFRGMFAFALWDDNRQTLFLARDRLGIKPLYYAELPDGMVLFGSELKALVRHPGFRRRLDPNAVEDYFAYGYVPDPKTIYRGASKLAPAHTLTLKRGGGQAKPQPYWDVAFRANEAASEAEACEQLVALLREAVELRMIADVPLGAFLSGGVDSSAVVATMADLGTAPVETCSIGFHQPEFDESSIAAEVAGSLGTHHHMRRVDAGEFDLIDRLASIYDEPFADSSAIPTYRLAGLAREHVTVALSGDGGDEVFAGYRRYRWHRNEELVRRLLPAAVRRPLFGILGRVYPKLDWAPRAVRAKTTFQELAVDSVESYFNSVSIMPDDLRRQLFSPAMQGDLQGYCAIEVLRGHMENAPADHPLDRVQYADIKTYLPGDILTKVDRASMAHSLEVRVPMLDHLLVEWAACLPARLRLRGREGKYVLKSAMAPYLAKNILYREKMGFAVPLADWFRGPLRETVGDALTAGALADTGLFDMGFVAKLVDRHQSGMRDHSAALWALLMFGSFLRNLDAV